MAEEQSEARRIGGVIRQARVLQRRSQKDVAAALGYHQSKVSRLESGRGTEDVRTLREVAQVLDIPPHRLGLAAAAETGPAAEPGAEDMHRRTFLAASVAALAAPPSPSSSSTTAHHDLIQVLMPGTGPAATGQALGIGELRDRVRAVRRMFYVCDYAELEQALPGLIADLRLAADGGSSGSAEASGLLATAYQTSVSLLLKRADQGNAWLAAGRAMAEAERSEDPVVLAASVRVHAHVLVRDKHTAQAVNMIRHTADQLTGSYDQRAPRYLAALGLLLLRGATAASRNGDRDTTQGFLTEAKEVARYVAFDQPDAWANFSPTNVALHEVSAAVSFGDAGIALQTARPLMRRHIPVPERRAALWVETARAYSQQGRLADGYQALRIAESCAAQDIRRPAVRELVADMAARDRRRALPELHHFSRQLGVPA
ncbi:helix-turn-helix domain-containing protein [Streptomyces caniscabiei]|uniref:Helix-turn-helix transcriptional regulator n=1 Tax=Streptomyces caniscabiei TaxID=2746961 RepID=A0ABU4MZ46_9ACTN|nr:helix-turn-helix transcriptional regulator [Streptomyces caniscabiei]MBE4740562.1 helix-turn-helix transcriptional regulator [Streptomyces caniscabiei]MBE4761014.1 helix-turn-helix transcriptional regulator [Streptomyces caniscabiei]MBE4773524.1 helix-turn-helix transcriptional regulator [Streptomyces caniscabiei]MBE4789756.1 helix-turn-helix transcriptional regulator [Streptomyces caniscabiei]MBE4798940.1 helix-turn-helix transcriptional regulator [Streptomyces caniscabiei]